jgi:hypothetical protein
MKFTIFLSLLLFTGLNVRSQDWAALGDGSGTNNKVIALASYQGRLIAGGSFLLAGGQPVYRIAQWDGSAWLPMGGGFDDEVRSLAVYNGELYAAGRFNHEGSGMVPYPGMARWNGTLWQPVPVPDPLSYDYRALYVLNGELYATKHTHHTEFVVQVSKFNGTTWTDLPGTFTGPLNYKYLYALGEYQGKLVAGGVFDSVNGVKAHRIAIFDGTAWSGLDFPVPAASGGILTGRVEAIAEFEGKLFAGGIFADFQDTIFGSNAASYDGTGWTAYPWDENLGGVVNDFEVFNDRLLAAGEFGFWQGTEIAATCIMFDETSPNHWINLNFYNSLTGGNMNGQEMAVVDDVLYVGGRFDYAGSPVTPVNNVARFNGDIPTGVADGSAEISALVYPQPVSDRMFIKLPKNENEREIRIMIVDMSGKMVHQSIQQRSESLNVGHLPAGLYGLILDTGNQRYQGRFVKTNR